MLVFLSLCTMFWIQGIPMTDYQYGNICKYEDTIKSEAQRNSLDPALLAAVIYVESGFYKNVVSSAGACGLTQVVPKWTGGPESMFTKYTCAQLKDPKTSIRVGAEILSYHIRVYAVGNIDKGLCYYNAGTRCITKKGFYKRLGYVKKVKRIYRLLSDDHWLQR